MRKLIYLIIAIATLGCTEQKKNLQKESDFGKTETKKNVQKEFDFGKTESGVYKNDFFEMEVSFDPNWVIQDRQQMNKLAEMGGELMTGDDKILKTALKASRVNTAYLLSISKYELGAAVESNPSFIVVAENTKNFPGIKSGKDYLFHSKKLLEQSQVPYYFEKDMFERTIGKSNFYIMEARFDYLNKTIIQEYSTTIINGFSLAFIVSYTTDDEKNELYEIIENIKM